MTYAEVGRALADRLWAVKPGIQFELSRDFNDKAAIKRSLLFPAGTTEEQKNSARKAVDDFEGLFVQANQ